MYFLVTKVKGNLILITLENTQILLIFPFSGSHRPPPISPALLSSVLNNHIKGYVLNLMQEL